jgi:hypothetical protein
MSATHEEADWIAARMSDVVDAGGIFHDDVWLPVLEEGGINPNCTATFRVGVNDLVVLDGKWLIEPDGDGSWQTREWLGREDPHYAAAVEAEAVLGDAGDES